MMMGLERAGRESDDKGDFTKDVQAYSSNAGDLHDAELVVYTLTHKTSGKQRIYAIQANEASIAPLADYLHMEQDAQNFFAHPEAAPSGASLYQPLSGDAVDLLMRPQSDGTTADVQTIRQTVEGLHGTDGFGNVQPPPPPPTASTSTSFMDTDTKETDTK